MYICINCEYQTITKLGKCPQCGSFGSFEEKKEDARIKSKTVSLKANKNKENKFYDINNNEIKRVFTNGIKSSGVYLLAGQPGIGKSTITLQIINAIKDKINIGYFSGEEESGAIGQRNQRLFKTNPFFDIYHGTNLEDIKYTIKQNNINLFIIDSIQTIYSGDSSGIAGSINQVKYCSENLSEFCKKNNIACIFIGHITKSGEIAGPKYLEHIVDMVAYLEGDRLNEYRFLRTQKNRFGGTDDVAIFQMTSEGLKPTLNLKSFIESKNIQNPGNILSVGIDNGRPVLTLIEVLINKTKYKFPKRSTIGIDGNRLEMIIAVLERYLQIDIGFFDIFVNIPGEFKFYDSGLDLAIATGILSAYKNKNISSQNIFIGEISLSGNINKTNFHEKRIKETNGTDIIDYKNVKSIGHLKNFF